MQENCLQYNKQNFIYCFFFFSSKSLFDSVEGTPGFLIEPFYERMLKECEDGTREINLKTNEAAKKQNKNTANTDLYFI